MFKKIIDNTDFNDKIPWVEKYKPIQLSDIVGQEKTINSLIKLINTKNMPHLLFYGPPGTGKTSAILAIAKQIYGKDNLKDRIIILNASQERGIKVVREKIKSFACNTLSSNKNLPPYKIIILDEADTITNDAQTALRRSMETYSHITRFCIICNYVTKIIEPITSRCALYKFDSINKTIFFDKIINICNKEKIKINKEVVNLIFKVSDGDLRNAINLIQYSSLLSDGEITTKELFLVSGELEDKKIQEFLMNNNFTFKMIKDFIKELLLEGNSSDSITSSLLRNIISKNNNISELEKAKIGLAICKSNKKMSNGSSEYLNLLNIFCTLLNE